MLVKLDRKIKLKKVFDDKNLGLKKANKFKANKAFEMRR